MLITTTNTIEGRAVQEYMGIVTGEAILGANIFKDITAGIRDIVGGRSGHYENEMRKARETALQELTDEAAALGATAILGVDIDYEFFDLGNGMLMVTAAGTAVKI